MKRSYAISLLRSLRENVNEEFVDTILSNTETTEEIIRQRKNANELKLRLKEIDKPENILLTKFKVLLSGRI